MNNLFDSSNYPDGIPSELVAGVRWAWTAADVTAAYPTATYTLKYRLQALASPYSQWTITAGKVSSAHVVEEAQADTRDYTPGDYQWRAIIVRDSDSEEVEADAGFVAISAALDTAGTIASWTYQVLSAIRTALLSGASSGQRSVQVGGRTVEWRSYAELVGLEREFSGRWAAEKAAADRKAGRITSSRVLVKMSA